MSDNYIIDFERFLKEDTKICLMISGYSGSGKDTAQEMLKDKGFIGFAFAAKLKDMTSVTYDIPREWFDDRSVKEMPIAKYPVVYKDVFSKIMQEKIYTHFRTLKSEKPDSDKVKNDPKLLSYNIYNSMLYEDNQLYWTPRALCVLEGNAKRAVSHNFWIDKIIPLSKQPFVTITDFRYPNEYYRIKELFPDHKVIAIRIDTLEKSIDVDPSERALDNWDGFHCRILNEKKGKNQFWNDLSRELISVLTMM